ncbi:exonuclease GOR-like isoform X1 [Ornithodoros turicata]
MAEELMFLYSNSSIMILSALLGILILLGVLVFGQRKHSKNDQTTTIVKEEIIARKEVRVAGKKKQKVQEKKKEVKSQYVHPWLVATLKGHTGTILDLDFSVNGKYLATTADGGLHHRLNGQNRTPKESVSPLDGAWRLPLGQADLYHQLLRYVLSPQELRSCGYPRPNPGDPGRAMWDQPDDDIDPNNPSRRTCCRCGEPFTMTPGGEYTASSPCVYHRGKRGGPGGNYGCCGGEDGCVRSEYHVCARGGDDPDAERGFVRTRSRRGSLQHQGGIYALDCEMCFTKRGLEVARVSVVGADGATVYDSYVQPEHPVLDYNTAFSGVTEEHLKGVRTTLQDVQAVLLRLFSASTVLVGHGLENDLRALKLLHSTVVDTAVVFPHHRGLPYRRSLRSLVSAYLSREVQEGAHDSVEDARACMQLLLWKANKDHKIRERRNRGSGCRLQPSL